MEQKGFTVVEFLLTVIALGVLAGVGLYAYNSIKDKQHDEALKTEVTQKKTATAQPKASTPKIEYIEFPNAGVKVKKTNVLKDFYFKTSADAPNSYYVHHTAYDEAAKECYGAADFAKMTDAIDNSISGFGKTLGSYSADEVPGESLLKQFKTFYISIGYPNGGIECDNNADVDNMKKVQKELNDIIVPALEEAEEL